MAKPAIVTVDDDPQVLSAVRRDLRSKYSAGYRIVSAPSGREALAATEQLKGRIEQGFDELIFNLPAAPAEEILPRLDHLAAVVRQIRD